MSDIAPQVADADDVLGTALVLTPEIGRLATRLMDWIRMDSPGAHVCGPMRAGKTRACKFLVLSLPNEMSGMIAIHWTIPKEPPSAELDLLRNFMSQSGNFSTGVGYRSALRQRLVNHLHMLAASRQARRILVVVDEANRLTPMHYRWLMSVFNEIELRPLKPFFLLVGEPSLHAAMSRFKSSASAGLLGRFFSHHHVLSNIQHADLAATLEALEASEEGSRLGARSFLPHVYARGFRLVALAPQFSQALQLFESKHQIGISVGIPMQYLRSTVVRLLLKIQRCEIDPMRIGTPEVFGAIVESGFGQLIQAHAAMMPSLRQMQAESEGMVLN